MCRLTSKKYRIFLKYYFFWKFEDLPNKKCHNIIKEHFKYPFENTRIIKNNQKGVAVGYSVCLSVFSTAIKSMKKKIISILLAASMLAGASAMQVGAVGEYDDYPYTITKCEYNSGTVTVEAKGADASTAKAIHISFFKENSGTDGNTKIINKNVAIRNVTSLGGNMYRMSGVVQNTNLAGGDYRLSIALTDSTGDNGEKVNYLSNYKILNTDLPAGNIGGDITAGIIAHIMDILTSTGETPWMKIESDTILYIDPECTREAITLHPGSNDREPKLYQVFGSNDIQTNTVAIVYNGLIFYTHPDTMSDYKTNVSETVTDYEKKRFTSVLNKGMKLGSWTSIKSQSDFVVGNRIIINDLETGKFFAMKVVAKGNFLSVEPATKTDTMVVRNLIGKWHKGSRSVWVYTPTQIFPAALNCVLRTPKLVSVDNDLDGYLELYFNGSTDARGNTVKTCTNSIDTAYERGKNIGIKQSSS